MADHASRNLHNLLVKRPEFDQGDYVAAMKGAVSDEDGVLLESFKHETSEPAMSGSTVAACFVNLTKGELVVANLGDSHVILAERDPKTEYPYHIVGAGLLAPHWVLSSADNSRISDVSPRLTSPTCPVNEPVSKKQAALSTHGAGPLVSVSAPLEEHTATKH